LLFQVTDNAWWQAPAWLELNAIGSETRSGFAAGAIALRDGSATVGLVECLNAHLSAHCHALAVSLLGTSTVPAEEVKAREKAKALRTEVMSLVQELRVTHAALQRAADVAQSLFATQDHPSDQNQEARSPSASPGYSSSSENKSTSCPLSLTINSKVLHVGGSNVAERAAAAIKAWPTFTVQQTRGLLEDHVCEGAPQLVLALPWLQHLCKCSAFTMIWQQAATSVGGLYALLQTDKKEEEVVKQGAPSFAKTTSTSREASSTLSTMATTSLNFDNNSFNKEALYMAACQMEIEASEAAAEKLAHVEHNASSTAEDAAEVKEVASSETRALKLLFAMARHPSGTMRNESSGKYDSLLLFSNISHVLISPPFCPYLLSLFNKPAHTNTSDKSDDETLLVPDLGAQGHLLRAFLAWHHLWRGLSDQSLPFVLLQDLAPALLAPLNSPHNASASSSSKAYIDGLEALSGSAPAARRHLIDSLRIRHGALPRFVWPSGLPDSAWCHHQRRTLKRFELLATLRRSRNDVARSLIALQKLIKPDAQPEVRSTCIYVSSLQFP